MIVNVTINTSEFANIRDAVDRAITPGKINKIMAEAATERTQNHLRELGASRDRNSRFYGDYVRVTHAEFSDTESMVVIPPVFNRKATSQRGNPLALRLFGGDVFPTAGHKYLTIPVGDARGTLAWDYNGALEPAFGNQKGGGIGVIGLRQKDNAEISGPAFTKGRLGKIKRMLKVAKKNMQQPLLFWLVKSTHHEPNDTILPSNEEYQSAVGFALLRLLR